MLDGDARHATLAHRRITHLPRFRAESTVYYGEGPFRHPQLRGRAFDSRSEAVRRSLGLRAGAIGVAVAAAVSLAGCSRPDNTPKFYGEATEALFLSGCTGNYELSAATIAATNTCGCMYGHIRDNIPASEDDKLQRLVEGQKVFAGYTGKTFAQIDSELKNSPDRVTSTELFPQVVLDKFKTCPGYGGNTGTTGTTGNTGNTGTTGSTGTPGGAPSVGPTVPATSPAR